MLGWLFVAKQLWVSDDNSTARTMRLAFRGQISPQHSSTGNNNPVGREQTTN